MSVLTLRLLYLGTPYLNLQKTVALFSAEFI